MNFQELAATARDMWVILTFGGLTCIVGTLCSLKVAYDLWAEPEPETSYDYGSKASDPQVVAEQEHPKQARIAA
jgi:hypothetical protein